MSSPAAHSHQQPHGGDTASHLGSQHQSDQGHIIREEQSATVRQLLPSSPQAPAMRYEGTPPRHPNVASVPPPLAVGVLTPPGAQVTLATPSRQLQSVGTQHDEQTYAQWFYTEVRPLTTSHATLPQVNVGGVIPPVSSKRRRSAHNGSMSAFVSGSTVVTDPNHHNLIKDFVVPAGYPNLQPMVSSQHPSTNDFTPDRRVSKPRRRRPDPSSEGADVSRDASSTCDSSAPTDCSDSTEGEEGAVFSEAEDSSLTSQGDVCHGGGAVEGDESHGHPQPPVLLAVNSEASELASLSSGADKPAASMSTSATTPTATLHGEEGSRSPSTSREGSLTRPRAVGEENQLQTIATVSAAPHQQAVQHSSQLGGNHPPPPHGSSYQHPAGDTRRGEHHSHNQHHQHHEGQPHANTHGNARQGGSSGPVNFVTNCLCPPSLAAELEAYALLRLQLRQDETRDRNRYISLIERVVQNVLGKRATVTVHGSFATGVALQSSDIDVLVRHYEPTQPLVAIERVSNALFALESYDIPDLSGNVVGTPAAGTPVTVPQHSTTEALASLPSPDFPSDPQRQRSEGSTTSPMMTPSSTPTTTSAPHLPPMGAGGGSLFDPSATMTRHGQILSVQTIVATRVPVVKVREILTGHRCDVSFGGGEHFPSMELTKSLLARHPSSRSLLLLLKYVVKKMQIGETEPGGITSFPLYLLAIHFYEHGLLTIHNIRHGGVMPSSLMTSPAMQPAVPSAAALPNITKSPQQQHDDVKRKLVQQTLQQALDSAAGSQGGSEGSQPHTAPQRIVDTIGSYLYGAEGTPQASTAASAAGAGADAAEHHDESDPLASTSQPPVSVLGEEMVSGGSTESGAPDVAPIPLSTSPPPPPPPTTTSPIATAVSVESSLSVGQVVLDFCIYYAYLFDYERHGIRFSLDGTSAVVEKPPQCNARGQHLHMTGPFDPRADITARMAHTREFQAMCGGIATILSGGTLTHLLTWVAPESLHDDLHAVYHYLQATMPHLYPAAAAAAAVAAASQHQAAVYSQHHQQQHYNSQQHRHHGGHRHHHPSSSSSSASAYHQGNGNSNASMNVLVGGGGGQQGRSSRGHHSTASHNTFGGPSYHQDPSAHIGAGGQPADGSGGGAPVGPNAAAARSSPHLVGLGYVNPYARSNTPVVQQHHNSTNNNGYPSGPTMAQHMASLQNGASSGPDAPPYASHGAAHHVHHQHAAPHPTHRMEQHIMYTTNMLRLLVTTGTMTTFPQAPPMQIPPLQSAGNTRAGQPMNSAASHQANTVASSAAGVSGMYVNALIGAGATAVQPASVSPGAPGAGTSYHLHHHQHHQHHHHHHLAFAAATPPPQQQQQGTFAQAVLPGYATAASAATQQPQQPVPTVLTTTQFPSVAQARRPSVTSNGAATTPRPSGPAAASTAAAIVSSSTTPPTVGVAAAPAQAAPAAVVVPAEASSSGDKDSQKQQSKSTPVILSSTPSTTPVDLKDIASAAPNSRQKKAKKAKAAAAEAATTVPSSAAPATASPATPAVAAPTQRAPKSTSGAPATSSSTATATATTGSTSAAIITAPAASKKKKKKPSAVEADAPAKSTTSEAPSTGSRRGGGGNDNSADAPQQQQQHQQAPVKQRQQQSTAVTAPPVSSTPIIPAIVASPPTQSLMTVNVTVNAASGNGAKYVPPFRRMQIEEQQRQGPSQ
ncbi:nucleotidyl transferase, putative [Bodo saltans]|uniref:Nucleotidyl transferase, putative n=1 Tax=Bodo saltans TaxID=75058 RepID=A0A0S4JCR1_BODSA|nr:nucleotidyl transferase, putative [Bodo saltans]|eukprot:CUG87796.1 nucleotidyl transferase, putative [Bodo saltans]